MVFDVQFFEILNFRSLCQKYLLLGFRVKTDLFNAQVTMKGGFASDEDEYDPDRHTVHVRMAPTIWRK